MGVRAYFNTNEVSKRSMFRDISVFVRVFLIFWKGLLGSFVWRVKVWHFSIFVEFGPKRSTSRYQDLL